MNYATDIKAVVLAKPRSNDYEEVDWLRCICILLVVTFHIVYIEQQYAAIYAIVGIFHVPVFLIISGYLANVERPAKVFIYSISGNLVKNYNLEESGDGKLSIDTRLMNKGIYIYT